MRAGAERVGVEPARVKRTTWKEYGIRFLFGGLVTVLAAWVGRGYGPGVGGLFLAFPAILPASLTLIRSHEGEAAAARDALGAIAGSVGLAAFAAVGWSAGLRLGPVVVLLLASAAWLGASLLAWLPLRSAARRLPGPPANG